MFGVNLSNFHLRSSNTLLLMTYFEQYDSFSMQDTQQYYAIKYDRFLRKKLCPWDKNQLNVFF